MITQKNLETLERLYTPLSKILLEHLRVDHEYIPVSKFQLNAINQQQANRIRDLTDALDDTTKEFLSLKADYKELQEINQNLITENHSYRYYIHKGT